MRQLFRWFLPVLAIVVAASGCSTTQHRQSPMGALSGRNVNPAATTHAQLAGYLPGAVQPPAGGYQAGLASASRSGPAARRFQIPKCMTSS